MMRPWTQRLEERLEHGRQKHGDDVFLNSTHWLLNRTWNEAADIGGWALVLRARAEQYPDGPERDAALHAVRELGRYSMRLHWGVGALAAWLPSSWLRSLPQPGPALPWITRPADALDETYPQMAAGFGLTWGDHVLSRLRRGRETYGEASFARPGGELCLEIGDECCALAGWAWIVRERVAVSDNLLAPVDVIDRQLRGLARVAAHTYGLACSTQLLCVGQDAAPPATASRLDAGAAQWLTFVAQTTRRSVA